MKKLMTRLLSLVLLGAFIPSFVLADSWYLENGDITIKATSDTSQPLLRGKILKKIQTLPLATGTRMETMPETPALLPIPSSLRQPPVRKPM